MARPREVPEGRESSKRRDARQIVNKLLNYRLRLRNIVHHVDNNVDNLSNDNLVVCEDHAYHMLIHQRTDAYYASGHANWLKCRLCGKYDAPENLYVQKKKGGIIRHNECHRKAEYVRTRPKLTLLKTEKEN